MYIVANYIYYPVKNGKETITIGDEIVSIVRKLKNTDLKRSNLILDVVNKEVLKCRSFMIDNREVTDPTYDMLLEHFQKSHPNEINALLKLIEIGEDQMNEKIMEQNNIAA